MKRFQRGFTTVLCDLDGTLIDSRHDIAAAFQWALRLVIDTAPPAAHIVPHIGKPLEQIVRELGYQLSPPQLSIFLDAYRQYYAQHCAHATRPYPEVEITLQRLSHIPFGIVTTKLQEQAETVLHQLALTKFFRHIQGWQPGLRLKPAPDMLLVALEALHCQPEQTLMVGDTAADILAGKAAGAATCAVTYGYGSVEELRRCEPEYIIGSFCELQTLVSPPSAPCSRQQGQEH
jgi:phosphoglycolate phosphatase